MTPAPIRALVEAKIRRHVEDTRAALAEVQYREAIGDAEGVAAQEATIARRRAAFRHALTDELARLGYALELATSPEGDPVLVRLDRPEAA